MKKYVVTLLFALLFFVGTLNAQNAVILDNLDQQAFLTCGNCGNTGSAGATAVYSEKTVVLPSRDGLGAEFSIAAPNAPYSNGYWYQKRYMTVTATNFEYEFDMMIPQAYIDKPQAIEFEVQQNLNGRTYNYAWQALFTGTKTWRYFDKANRRWIDAKIPVQFTPDVWHHVKATFARTTDGTVHLTITVDGVVNTVNVANPSIAGSAKDYLSNAFQLDTNKYGAAYSVYVDKLTLKYW